MSEQVSEVVPRARDGELDERDLEFEGRDQPTLEVSEPLTVTREAVEQAGQRSKSPSLRRIRVAFKIRVRETRRFMRAMKIFAAAIGNAIAGLIWAKRGGIGFVAFLLGGYAGLGYYWSYPIWGFAALMGAIVLLTLTYWSALSRLR